MSEAARVQTAVAESHRLGTLSTNLVRLVERITRRRCCQAMSDDISQHVLLGLLRHLSTIRLDSCYEYITSAICKTWQRWMRDRTYQRKLMIHLVHEALEWVPSHDRPRAVRQAMGSFLRLRYLA